MRLDLGVDVDRSNAVGRVSGEMVEVHEVVRRLLTVGGV